MDNTNLRPVAAVPMTEVLASSYLGWPAIIAGALVGTAIFVTLTPFGSAIGLAITSPYLGQGLSAKATVIAITIWTLWVVVSSYIASGYIAGRMRHMTPDVSIHESEIRDGAHGLIAWALTTLLVGMIVSTALSGIVREAQSKTPEQTDHSLYMADALLRGERLETPYNEGLRREVAAILQSGVYNGAVTASDRDYLVRLVTDRGLTPVDAQKRVDYAITDVRDTANAKRKVGILAAFLSAAASAIGAAAAWWAATIGGQHRKNYAGVSIFTRWR